MRRFPPLLGSVSTIVGVLALVAATAQARPPARAEKGPARAIPRDNLVLFVEFDGLDAQADAWRGTAAYKMLNRTGAGAMIRDLVVDVLDPALASQGPDRVVSTEDLLAIDDMLVRKGFVFAINRRRDDPKSGGITLILRGAATGDAGKAIRRIIDAGGPREPKPEVVVRAGGRRVHVVRGAGPNSGAAWWAEGDDLIFCLGSADGADAILDTLDGKTPSALDNPTRAELRKEGRGFRPIGLVFLDLERLPKSVFPPQAHELGLDGITRLDVRYGFHDDALMTVLRIVAPRPRRGLLTLAEAPPFRKDQLPPIPPDQASFSVVSVKPDKLYDQVLALFRQLAPTNAGGAPFGGNVNFKVTVDDQAAKMLQEFRDATDVRLKEDVLAHLGPRVAFYVVPTIGPEPTNPFSGFFRGYVHLSRAVALVEVDDTAAFGTTLDTLATKANEAIRKMADQQPQAGGKKAPRAEFRAVKEGPKGYTLVVPPGVLPLPAGTRPTVLIGEHYLALARSPELARKALEFESKPDGRWKPAGALTKGFEALPDELTFLGVSDPRDSLMPELIVNLPNLVQMLGSVVSSRPQVQFPGAPPATPQVAFHVHTDPDKVPSADELRSYLFPATVAISVDEQGIRIATREAFPSLNPIMLAPVAAGVLLPAVESARSAAERAQSTNNLKMIGLAIHNYISVNDKLPATIRGKDGKALLSWRVAILPYIEQVALYNEFHLDEPWDSEHNKVLIDRMPNTLKVPGSTTKEPGLTYYRGFMGKGAMFEAGKDLTLANFTDGTANTIAVVEAKEAVTWTQPDNDVEFDPEKPLVFRLGGHFRGGFDALFLDGHVQFLKETIDDIRLKALVTRDGGEVVAPGTF